MSEHLHCWVDKKCMVCGELRNELPSPQVDKLGDIVWPITNTLRLVLIQGEYYTAYKGRRKIVTVKPIDPMNNYWLEQFRVDPARMLPDEPQRSA